MPFFYRSTERGLEETSPLPIVRAAHNSGLPENRSRKRLGHRARPDAARPKTRARGSRPPKSRPVFQIVRNHPCGPCPQELFRGPVEISDGRRAGANRLFFWSRRGRQSAVVGLHNVSAGRHVEKPVHELAIHPVLDQNEFSVVTNRRTPRGPTPRAATGSSRANESRRFSRRTRTFQTSRNDRKRIHRPSRRATQ